MDAFFPNNAADREPLPPSKAERISSWVIGVTVVPVLSLQAIGAVPLHAISGAGLGAIGETADSVCDLFHGILRASVPQIASLTEALPQAVAHGAYFGAVTLFTGAFAASVAMGMRREQKNFARRVGGPRCW
ncbi:hypothetical protein [Burkholderia contaminans]|uniref:hypothetical protein n=1 Tax=Burkholderia contaminans TaxID=488447 RepID=UPI002D80D946|nr:hypothetical protein [Burkholderia contaminans]